MPYRGTFGARRPAALSALALPPAAMPSHRGTRPLKAWRYIGAYGPELMLCVASVRVGRARQSFWAVWDRQAGRLHERTWLSSGGVRLAPGGVRVTDGRATLALAFEETGGIESVCPSGASYAWTRKQGGLAMTGAVDLGDGRRREIAARGLVDDTSAYYERHTRWRWCAGVGTDVYGRGVAWNLVSGVNDPAQNSERTVWVDGEPVESGPSAFAADLSGVDELRFSSEAVRESKDNLLLLRSRYRQPFGTFSGRLAGGIELAQGYGVMEEHDVWW